MLILVNSGGLNHNGVHVSVSDICRNVLCEGTVTRLSSSTKSTIPSRRQANYTATSVLGIGELETYTKHLTNVDSSTTKFVGIVVDVASNRSAVKARNTKTITLKMFLGYSKGLLMY